MNSATNQESISIDVLYKSSFCNMYEYMRSMSWIALEAMDQLVLMLFL